MKTLENKFEEWAKANNIQNRWGSDSCDYYAHKTGFFAGYELAQEEQKVLEENIFKAVDLVKEHGGAPEEFWEKSVEDCLREHNEELQAKLDEAVKLLSNYVSEAPRIGSPFAEPVFYIDKRARNFLKKLESEQWIKNCFY